MKEMKDLIENGSPIIDVRTSTEYWMGHADNTINIPLNKIEEKIEELKQMDQPLLLCCRSGARSGTATDLLRAEGIECYNLGSWKNAKL